MDPVVTRNGSGAGQAAAGELFVDDVWLLGHCGAAGHHCLHLDSPFSMAAKNTPERKFNIDSSPYSILKVD